MIVIQRHPVVATMIIDMAASVFIVISAYLLPKAHSYHNTRLGRNEILKSALTACRYTMARAIFFYRARVL